MKGLWRRIRRPLARSRLVKVGLASAISGAVRVIRWTNPLLPESDDLLAIVAREGGPVIFTMWHGQHLTSPAYMPRGLQLVAMVSRSDDAEVNAMVLQRFGIGLVRGSGGREGTDPRDKGGARALIALKKTLDAGKNAFMIADIPHGTPRDAGLGIVTLARLSGRPIVPVGIAATRRKVFEKSWDRTTLALPFGRSVLVAGKPVRVARDEDEGGIEARRHELTQRLEETTARAYRLVDGRR